MSTVEPFREEDSTPLRHCEVLVSGGIDSTACIDFYLRQDLIVTGFHVSYGQPAAEHEKRSAHAVAEFYGIPLRVMEISGFRAKQDGEIIGRNAMLVFAAVMERQNSHGLVALGIHSGTSYYDCSPSFLDRAQAVVDGYCDGRIRLSAPFLKWTKQEIWDYCHARSIPVHLTYSCEKGLDQPCGCCLSCRDLEALRDYQKLHDPA